MADPEISPGPKRLCVAQIDRDGREILSIKNVEDGLMFAGPFREGLAPFHAKSLKAGFLDRNGIVVIPPIYERVENFYEGLAIVIDNGLAGFIGRDGHAVITPRFQADESLLIKDVDLFSEALAPARKDALWGYIDHTGSFAIKAQYQQTKHFRGGRAGVLLDGEWGYVDRGGRFVLDPTARLTFCEGLARERIGVKVGYRAFDDQWAIQPRYEEGLQFAEGYALVRDGGRSYYINRTGQIAVNPPLQDRNLGEYGSFSEGLAKSPFLTPRGDIRYGYIDPTGNWVIEPAFFAAHEFSESLVRVGTRAVE